MTAALQSVGIGAGAGLVVWSLVEAWARHWGRLTDDRAADAVQRGYIGRTADE